MSQDHFDGTPGSQVEQGPVRQTEGSPVRPTSEAISDALMDLNGPPFSSTPANQQRVRGARPFSSPSPVPSASRSYKRTRLDDSSPSNASMRLHMDASADSLNPYDIPDDVAQWPAGDFSGSQSGVGTSRTTCNLQSRPGWTSTSSSALRMLWNVR